MNRLAKEPVSVAVIVPIIVWVVTYFGIDMDEATATAIAGGVLAILGLFARQKVTPVADPHDNQGHKLTPEVSEEV